MFTYTTIKNSYDMINCIQLVFDVNTAPPEMFPILEDGSLKNVDTPRFRAKICCLVSTVTALQVHLFLSRAHHLLCVVLWTVDVKMRFIYLVQRQPHSLILLAEFWGRRRTGIFSAPLYCSTPFSFSIVFLLIGQGWRSKAPSVLLSQSQTPSLT